MSQSSFKQFASVVLDQGFPQPLDYGIPEDIIEQIKPGTLVEVPMRNKPYRAYVLSINSSCSFPKVKGVRRVLSEEELLSKELLKLALWMAQYYGSPLGSVFRCLIPAAIRKDKGAKQQWTVRRAKSKEFIRQECIQLLNSYPSRLRVLEAMLQVKKEIFLSELLEKADVSRSPVDTLVKQGFLSIQQVQVDRSPLEKADYFRSQAKSLNSEQEQALQCIKKSLDENRHETRLLFGVTGSGKTEVYLQAIQHALSLNKGSIVLVPEIALTEQTIERFRSRFDNSIAILHHRLSEGERYDEWHRIKRGEAKIVIGARSAVFSPVENLGLIIVDEEHESSYKQNDESPCYHARDIAVMRGHLHQATVLLGTATPSLESYYNAQNGKYCLSELTHRAQKEASLPSVHIVDMKREFERNKGFTSFSEQLLNGIQKRLELGEQCILFLNRRGYHSLLKCLSCGEAVKCSHCDLSLTFHLGENQLACHLCGHQICPPPKNCPECNEETMKFRGIGTEQIERAIHAIFPEVRTLRMDADTTKHKGSHQKLIREFRSGKADVLIGTQMIAKGLHFPQVTLVGIINCDGTINIPDFRASENAFQLTTQVAGRAGRGVSKGEVFIQTTVPENSTIQKAALQDYKAFYEEEIAVRQIFDYPPFTHLAKLSFTGINPDEVTQFAQSMRQGLLPLLPSNYEINPLVPCGYARIKDRFRFQFLVKGSSMIFLNKAILQLKQSLRPPKHIRIHVDIDPNSTFF
ncbi:MAG: primosomal protein N' [Waddliaceae bacterium]|nr:primosomal protein N' [Waddliaceae bacterium]